MERFTLKGGNKLYGEVNISAAKNSVLPLISASILSEGKTYIRNCPKISDVFVMTEIIKSIGGKAYFDGDSLVVDTSSVSDWRLPEELTKRIRASFFYRRRAFVEVRKSGRLFPRRVQYRQKTDRYTYFLAQSDRRFGVRERLYFF